MVFVDTLSVQRHRRRREIAVHLSQLFCKNQEYSIPRYCFFVVRYLQKVFVRNFSLVTLARGLSVCAAVFKSAFLFVDALLLFRAANISAPTGVTQLPASSWIR